MKLHVCLVTLFLTHFSAHLFAEVCPFNKPYKGLMTQPGRCAISTVADTLVSSEVIEAVQVRCTFRLTVSSGQTTPAKCSTGYEVSGVECPQYAFPSEDFIRFADFDESLSPDEICQSLDNEEFRRSFLVKVNKEPAPEAYYKGLCCGVEEAPRETECLQNSCYKRQLVLKDNKWVRDFPASLPPGYYGYQCTFAGTNIQGLPSQQNQQVMTCEQACALAVRECGRDFSKFINVIWYDGKVKELTPVPSNSSISYDRIPPITIEEPAP